MQDDCKLHISLLLHLTPMDITNIVENTVLPESRNGGGWNYQAVNTGQDPRSAQFFSQRCRLQAASLCPSGHLKFPGSCLGSLEGVRLLRLPLQHTKKLLHSIIIDIHSHPKQHFLQHSPTPALEQQHRSLCFRTCMKKKCMFEVSSSACIYLQPT